MAWRFRRSLKLGPLKLNLSKSGVGYSVGVRGFRVGKDAKGRSYTAASIPGTGLYNRTYSSAAKSAAPPALSAGATGAQPSSGRGLALFLLFAGGVLVGVLLMGILFSSSAPAPVTPPVAVSALVAPPQPIPEKKRRRGHHPKPASDALQTRQRQTSDAPPPSN
jgi:Protein of unknown function (DUF4236)